MEIALYLHVSYPLGISIETVINATSLLHDVDYRIEFNIFVLLLTYLELSFFQRI